MLELREITRLSGKARSMPTYVVKGVRAMDSGPQLEGLLKDHGAVFRDAREDLVVEFRKAPEGTTDHQLRSSLETALEALGLPADIQERYRARISLHRGEA